MVFQPALDLVLFNGTPETRKMVLETVDGMLAHRKLGPDGKYVTRTDINFKTDEDLPGGDSTPDFMFWAAYRWTGDKKYLLPFMDAGPSALANISSDALDLLGLRETWGKQALAAAGPPIGTAVATTSAASASGSAETFAWQVSGDTKYLDRLYGQQLEDESNREWINTEGSLWIDRVTDSAGPMFVNTELQRARFGGVALVRNHIYPGNAVSWRFMAPAKATSLGILIPEATPDHVKIIVYNLDSEDADDRMGSRSRSVGDHAGDSDRWKRRDTSGRKEVDCGVRTEPRFGADVRAAYHDRRRVETCQQGCTLLVEAGPWDRCRRCESGGSQHEGDVA
jgi:hypothetical protein